MSSEKIILRLDIKDAGLEAVAIKVLKRWATPVNSMALWDITEHNHIVRYRFDKVLPTGRWEYDGNQAVFQL